MRHTRRSISSLLHRLQNKKETNESKLCFQDKKVELGVSQLWRHAICNPYLICRENKGRAGIDVTMKQHSFRTELWRLCRAFLKECAIREIDYSLIFFKKILYEGTRGTFKYPLTHTYLQIMFLHTPNSKWSFEEFSYKNKGIFWIAHWTFFGDFKNIIPFKTIKIIWRVFQVIPWWWINCFDNPLAKQEVATESDPNGSQLRILTFRFAENSNNLFCFEVNAVPMIEGESKYHSPDAKKNIAPTPYGRACVVCGQRTKFSCYGCSLDSFGPVHICHPKYDRENRNCWSHCHQIRSIEYQYHTEYKS